MRSSKIELVALTRKLLLAIVALIRFATEECVLARKVLIILKGIVIYYLISSIQSA
jgi:hypothetical protein